MDPSQNKSTNSNAKERAINKKAKRIQFEDLFVRSPREYILMFKERWYWGILPALCAAVLVIFLEFRKTPVYKTEASIHFETRDTSPITTTDSRSNQLTATDLNNHIQKLRSRDYFSYLNTFLNTEQIERIQRAYRDNKDPSKPPPSITNIILKNLNVRVRAETTIVQIGVGHRNPEIAAELANLIASRYIGYNMDKSRTTTNSAVLFLQREAEALQSKVRESENALQQYRSEHNMITLGDEQNLIKQRVASTNVELLRAELEKLEINSQLEKVKSYKTAGKDLLELPIISTFNTVPQLMASLETLIIDYQNLSERYLEKHPRITNNLHQQTTITDELEKAVERAVLDLETRYRITVEDEMAIQSRLTNAEVELLELDKISVAYELLVQESETVKANYVRVKERLTDAMLTIRMDNTNISLFDQAYIPFDYSEPNMTKAIFQGSFIGFFVLLVIPLTFGVLDTRLKSSWDVEEILEANLVGEIPQFKRVANSERNQVVLKGLGNNLSEAFRGIYSHIHLNSPQAFPRVLIVTSTVSNEGKSQVSANLAATFASYNRRTLLVDCDFRKPSQSELGSGRGNRGFIKWLKDPNSKPEELLDEKGSKGMEKVSENFWVLKAGGLHKNPSPVFETDLFERAILYLKSKFDVVILDTPPVGIFPDALLLSKVSDELLFICRFNKISKLRLRSTVEKLTELELHFLGTVLNAIPIGNSSSYYGYYGYGSGNEEEYQYYANPKKKKKTQREVASKTA